MPDQLSQYRAQVDELLTGVEAANSLGVSASFLAKQRMRGTGPEFIRIGRAIRYSRSALDAYKAANTRVSTSEYQRPPAAGKPVKSRGHVRPKGPKPASTSINHNTSVYFAL